jgi:hypothetical protein
LKLGRSTTFTNRFIEKTPYLFEHMAQDFSLAEATVAVLGEGRVIGHGIFDAEAAEPAIGQVQPDLFA